MNTEVKERFKQTMNLKGAMDDKAVKDKCVSCECDTLYDKHHHIDFRIGYVEGAGQLCLDCYGKIYVPERPKCNDWRFDTMDSHRPDCRSADRYKDV